MVKESINAGFIGRHLLNHQPCIGKKIGIGHGVKDFLMIILIDWFLLDLSPADITSTIFYLIHIWYTPFVPESDLH